MESFGIVYYEFLARIRNIAYVINENALTKKVLAHFIYSIILFCHEAFFFIILSFVKPPVYQVDQRNKVWVSFRQGLYKIIFSIWGTIEILGLITAYAILGYEVEISGRFKDYDVFSNNFLTAANPTNDIEINSSQTPTKKKHIVYYINRANYKFFDTEFYYVFVFMYRMHAKVYKYDQDFEIRYIDIMNLINYEIANAEQNTPYYPYSTQLNNFLAIAIQVIPTYAYNAIFAYPPFATDFDKIVDIAFSQTEDCTMSFAGLEVGGAYFTLIAQYLLSNPKYQPYVDKISNIFYLASSIYLFNNFDLPKNNLNFHQMFGIDDYTSHFPLNMLSVSPKLNGNLSIIPFNYWNIGVVQYLSFLMTPDTYQYMLDRDFPKRNPNPGPIVDLEKTPDIVFP
jgi:hypothetical protein